MISEVHMAAVLTSVAYIEAHLTEPSLLTLDCLSSVCGYSSFHLLRLFRSIVGLTPADYIRKRRLTEVIRYVSQYGGYFEAAAYLYGFQSKEHFSRAFLAEHHILPSAYRAAQNSLRLYERFSPQTSYPPPVCRIETISPFTVIAYPNTEPEIPQFWNKYNAGGFSLQLSGGKVVRDYGCMRWNPCKKQLDYWIGICESDVGMDRSSHMDAPHGTERILLGGGDYAHFTTLSTDSPRFVSVIRRTWDQIRVWFEEQTEWQRIDGFEWECYTEKSRLFYEEIYIPIVPSADLS